VLIQQVNAGWRRVSKLGGVPRVYRGVLIHIIAFPDCQGISKKLFCLTIWFRLIIIELHIPGIDVRYILPAAIYLCFPDSTICYAQNLQGFFVYL